MNLTTPTANYVIINYNRLKDLRKWPLFKIDLGSSMYGIENNNKVSKIDYIIAYHSVKFDKILQKIGNAGNLFFYTDSLLNYNKIQVVIKGEQTEIDWLDDSNMEDNLRFLLQKATTKPNNIETVKPVDDNIEKATQSVAFNNHNPEDLKKKWLEMLNKG